MDHWCLLKKTAAGNIFKQALRENGGSIYAATTTNGVHYKGTRKNGCVYVRKIAQEIGVTEKTIRQDLIRMEQMGILDRVHGGAVQKKRK